MDTTVPVPEAPRLADVTPLERSDRRTLAVLAAIACVHLALFAYVAVNGLVRRPYSDMLDFLRAECGLERTGDLAAYLALEHNHQHLVWARLLTALDVQAFHGGGVVFAMAAALCLGLGAAAIAAELWRSTPRRMVGAGAGVLATLFIASTVNVSDCTQPINSVYAIAFGFSVLAIVLFERAGPRGRGSIFFAGGALVAGLAAIAGSGAGVAVFPALIVSAFRSAANRALRLPTLVVGLAAMGLVATTLIGAETPAHAPRGVAHLVKMGGYFLDYAGLPWLRARPLIGVADVGLAAALLWRGSRQDGAAGRLERIGLDLITFGLATAVMATVGRVDEQSQIAASVRYSIFMSAFQAGVLCVLAPAVAERWIRARRYGLPAAVTLACLLLFQQAVAGASALRISKRIKDDITAFNAGARRPEMRELVHPDFDLAEQVYADCRRRGLYR